MRGSSALLGVIVASAVAAPATAEPCTVQMVRVPDDVRPVIERWVAAEPSCRVKLAVRVLATNGGLYVIATDGAGLVRERLVPDATTAGVLIASWVADDGAGGRRTPAPANPPVTPTWAQASPPVRPAWAQTHPPVKPSWVTAPAGGPGTVSPTAATTPTDLGAPRPARDDDFRRLVGFGLSMHPDGAGLRGEIDFLEKWRVRFGILAAWSHTTNADDFDNLSLDDIAVSAFAGNELRFGRLDVRATIGAGFAITTVTSMSTGESQSLLSPLVDASFTAGVSVTRHFEIRAGVDLAYVPQRIHDVEGIQERELVPQALIAVGYRGD